MALAAPSLRIEAPVPGQSFVGIEVPNDSIEMVGLRGVLESEAFDKLKTKAPLAFALGRDVSGMAVAADLASMPHILIAGTTGSGKSVCINAIIMSLIMDNTPDDLRVVMIDPKMVELIRYNGLPHLYGKVESEIERIVGVLRWVTREMDSRYKKFSDLGVRHVNEYNERMIEKGADKLPHMAVFIDELIGLDDERAGGSGKDDLPHRTDGARHRHPSGYRHAAPFNRCGHRLDQSELPGAHCVCRGVGRGQPRHPGRGRCGNIARQG